MMKAIEFKPKAKSVALPNDQARVRSIPLTKAVTQRITEISEEMRVYD